MLNVSIFRNSLLSEIKCNKSISKFLTCVSLAKISIADDTASDKKKIGEESVLTKNEIQSFRKGKESWMKNYSSAQKKQKKFKKK